MKVGRESDKLCSSSSNPNVFVWLQEYKQIIPGRGMTESCSVFEKTYNIIATVFIDVEAIIIIGVSIGQFETRATGVSVSLNIMSLYNPGYRHCLTNPGQYR